MRDGAEDVVVVNTGGIFSDGETVGTGVYADFVGGDDSFTNTGQLIGRLDFGGGDDLFDGSLGTQGNGGVFGGEGNDRLYNGAGDNALYGEEGNDTLMGGAGADLLNGGAGSDRVAYSSATAGVVASLANPSINTGDAAGDRYISIENLSGTKFNDVLNGNSTTNLINGGNGNDVIKGYAGNDTLTGSLGSDTFVFNTALHNTNNVDTITDFNRVADTIQVDNAFFLGLAAGALAASAFKDIAVGAKDSNDRIIYNSDTGILYFDRDGSGSTYGNVKFAVLQGSPTINAADFFVI